VNAAFLRPFEIQWGMDIAQSSSKSSKNKRATHEQPIISKQTADLRVKNSHLAEAMGDDTGHHSNWPSTQSRPEILDE